MSDKDIKEEIKKRNKERKEREKKYLKQLEEENTSIEKEYEKLHPNYDKLNKESLFDAIFSKEEDKEFEELLSEEEKKEFEEEKKENIRYTIKAGIIFVLMIIVLSVGASIYVNYKLNYMDKIIKPKFENYYKEKYNEKIDVEDVEEITYKEKDENNKTVSKGTGIYYTKTESGNYMMYNSSLDIIGDDISITGIKNDFLTYMNNTIPEAGIISQELSLSYTGFYHEYNKYELYINSLPNGLNLVDLFNMGTLTANYEVIYQNDFDFQILQNTLNMLTSSSVFHFIKINYGDPVKYTKVTKDEIISLDITNQKQLDTYINYYQFDINKNVVSNVSYTEISTSTMVGLEDYSFTKAFKITPMKRKKYKGEKDIKNLYKYYLIRMKSSDIDETKIRQMQTSSPYQEILPENYRDVIIIESGGYAYIIGSEKEIVLAQIGAKKSFPCKFGIC